MYTQNTDGQSVELLEFNAITIKQCHFTVECNWTEHSFAIPSYWMATHIIRWVISGICHIPYVKFV